MKKNGLWVLLASCAAVPAMADDTDDAPTRLLGTVTVTAVRPTSLPTHIPTTIEGITGSEVAETINATDSEDALKYFPSLLVRKRYVGDYDHAVLATRASGTGNSARSLVYADGILLSNLLGNGATFTPRWGLVTPEEIERVDVLYGPFSAAFPGNSVGAVVDYVTRMPDDLEMHAKLTSFGQDFAIYDSADRFFGWQASASAGDRTGDFAWWVNFNHLDSDGQPLSFANKLVSAGVPGSAGTPVSGAIPDRNPRNQDWLILGSTTQIHTIQDHAKAKLSYDFSPTVRASYTLGVWINDAERTSESYLRGPDGTPVYSGNINFGGRSYAVTAADFAPGHGDLTHLMHGLSVKSHGRGKFDWEIAASAYDYADDITRSPTVALPAADLGGAGRITDQGGTGWRAMALRGTWRPQGADGAHLVDVGLQLDMSELQTLVSNTADWIDGSATTRFSAFRGKTRLDSAYVQDSWRFADDWRVTLGARVEHWRAYDGSIANATAILSFAERSETYVSPKAAIAWQLTPAWVLKASVGRAVRMPTVSELYQGSISVDVIVNNDPNLKPEKSWTGELTAERELGNGLLRTTYFHEDTRDALYSQTNVTVVPNVTSIQNVDHLRTRGVELAYQANDVFASGFDLSASVTYAHSRTVANTNFPASVGKWQPRVPDWRANALANYRFGERWSASLGGRYSGTQYNTLDNSDTNAFSFTGTSSFLVFDARVRCRFGERWVASVGVDNIGNEEYWAFHPYTQRTIAAELAANF
ncbi:MAG TPA: TonB-dependent receptor [Steroidobacteraceae bacterium]|nr:TonB-dependent receptor [Steroidobacteraceae bacterium]